MPKHWCRWFTELSKGLRFRTSNIELLTLNVKMDRTKYDLEERLMEFSARIIKVVDCLASTRTGCHIADQLIRSGTSAYPNHGEAQAAESNRDFIHKMRICLKELRETQRWLKLVRHIELIKQPQRLDEILDETEQLIKIFVTSIKTANKDKSSKLNVKRSMLKVNEV